MYMRRRSYGDTPSLTQTSGADDASRYDRHAERSPCFHVFHLLIRCVKQYALAGCEEAEEKTGGGKGFVKQCHVTALLSEQHGMRRRSAPAEIDPAILERGWRYSTRAHIKPLPPPSFLLTHLPPLLPVHTQPRTHHPPQHTKQTWSRLSSSSPSSRRS